MREHRNDCSLNGDIPWGWLMLNGPPLFQKSVPGK